jgi:hypothetical protein
LRAAIEHAGGRLLSSTASEDVYDATHIGLPAASKLDLIFMGPRFVLAQYEFPEYSATEERFRKMITTKYGQPVKSDSFGRSEGAFDAQYIGDGKYTWTFGADMQLVFDKPFSGNHTLSYVDRDAQSELSQLLKSRENQAAVADAKNKNSAF